MTYRRYRLYSARNTESWHVLWFIKQTRVSGTSTLLLTFNQSITEQELSIMTMHRCTIIKFSHYKAVLKRS
jgi:hypothetical protein